MSSAEKKLKKRDRRSRRSELEFYPAWQLWIFAAATVWMVLFLPGGLGL